jgi:glucans biosynthesis protein C
MTDLKPGAASAEPSRLPGTDRLHGLDTLRGIALLLGLVVHASLAFLPGGEHFWVVADPNPSALLGLAFYVPHMFRMILFFLISFLLSIHMIFTR